MSTELGYDVPNRADSVTIDNHTTDGGARQWVPASSQGGNSSYHWAIVDNEFSSVGKSKSYAAMDLGSPDHGVEFTITAFSGGVMDVAVRVSTPTMEVPNWTGYILRIAGSGALSIHRAISSSSVEIASASAIGLTAVVGDRVGIAIKGTMITVWINGKSFSYSDSTYLTGNHFGIFSQPTGSVAAKFKNIRFFKIAADPAYPFYPGIGWRMPWHIDGSTLSYFENNEGGFTPETLREELNDEDSTTALSETAAAGGGNLISVVFPEPRIITGVFLGRVSSDSSTPIVSLLNIDTTAWVVQANSGVPSGYTSIPTGASWRTAIWGKLPLTPSRGIRFTSSATMNIAFSALHLYGYIPQAPGVHRLRLWHPYLDIPLPGDYFDLDDIGRGTVRTREFRIKNLSLDMTANDISLDVQSPMYGAEVTDQFSLKKAASGVYVPTETLDELAPDTVSERFEWRRITPLTNPFRAEAPFVRLLTGSFS